MHAPNRTLWNRFRAALAALLSLPLIGCPGGGGGGTPLFAKSYGGDAIDYAADAIATPDGGYVLVGGRNVRTLGDAVVDEDLWVSKLDAYGDLEWSRVYSQSQVSVGTAANEYHYTIACARRGGGFFLVGTVDSMGPLEGFEDAPEDVGITRLDSLGNTLWSMSFGFDAMPTYPLVDADVTPSEKPLAVHATEDGGLLVAGVSTARVLVDGSSVAVPMPFAMRVDSNGSTTWQRHLDNEGYEYAGSEYETMFIADTSDDGAVVGVTGEFDPDELGDPEGTTGSRVTRLNFLGSVVWSEYVDEFQFEDMDVFHRTSAGDPDSVLLSMIDVNSFGLDAELLVLDSSGNVVHDETVDSDLERIDAAAVLNPLGSSNEVFLETGDVTVDVDGYPTYRFRAITFDPMLGAGNWIEYPSLANSLAVRPMSAPIEGFEFLGTTYTDAETKTGNIIRVRIDAAGGPVAFETLPIVIETFHERRSSRGSVPGGWVDGSTDVWTWRPLNANDLSEGFTLAVHDDSGELWSRVFAGHADRRIEHALNVEVIPGAEDPDAWELLVLGEIAFHPSSDPPPPGTALSPWLLRLDQDGELLSQRVLWGGKIPSASSGFTWEDHVLENTAATVGGRSAQSLAITAAGEVLVAVEMQGYSRVVRLDRDGNVLSISPSGLPPGYPIQCIAAAANGDALVASPWFVTRIAWDGTPIWSKETFRVSSICELADGTIAMGRTYPTDFGVTLESIVHVAADGSPLGLLSLGNPDFGTHGAETHLVPRADGGLYLCAQMRLSYSTFLGGYLPPGAWVQQIVAISPEMEAEWSQTYGGLLAETVGGFRGTPDGGLLIAGNSRSLAFSPEAWLLRMDSAGEISGSCAAAISRQDISSTYNATAQVTQDWLGGGGGDAPIVTIYDTAAVPTSVTDEIVVARQCSGKTNEKAPEGFALLQVVVASGSGQVIELTDGAEPRIDCPGTCEAIVPIGTTLDLYAAPAEGFDTPTWTGTDCGGAPSTQCSVTVTEDMVVTVDFPTIGGSELFDLTVVFAGAGTGTVSFQPLSTMCSDTCTQVDVASSGQTIHIIATPDSGSSFGGWSGADLIDGNFCSVLFTDSDRTVTVTFD